MITDIDISWLLQGTGERHLSLPVVNAGDGKVQTIAVCRLVEEMFDFVKQFNGSGLTILLGEQKVVRAMQIADPAFVLKNSKIRYRQLNRSYLRLAK